MGDASLLDAFLDEHLAAATAFRAGELIGRYRTDRRPLPAIALAGDPSVMTCIANDHAFDDVFARQVEALADAGDVVIGFTTSGRSAKVIAALNAAQARGAIAVAITGADTRDAGPVAGVVLAVPATDTPRVQELHTLVVHLLSDIVERWVREGQDGRSCR